MSDYYDDQYAVRIRRFHNYCPSYGYYDNYYTNYFPGGYQKRYRILQWEQQQYSGYIYVWNGYSWASQYSSSYAWRCSWSGWYYENYYTQNYNYNYNYQYWNK